MYPPLTDQVITTYTHEIPQPKCPTSWQNLVQQEGLLDLVVRGEVVEHVERLHAQIRLVLHLPLVIGLSLFEIKKVSTGL